MNSCNVNVDYIEIFGNKPDPNDTQDHGLIWDTRQNDTQHEELICDTRHNDTQLEELSGLTQHKRHSV
jgi:hypothetical protein